MQVLSPSRLQRIFKETFGVSPKTYQDAARHEGDVLSYSEGAKRIDKPKAVRAEASACAKNRIGVLIPCHRVLRGDGGLGGYRWGLERKQALIDLEASCRGTSR